MDHRSLVYFTTLIEEGSFTQAAKALFISQPSLSSAIKKFEDTVGLKLIDRSTRNISLTKEGEIMYEEAKKLLSHFNYFQKEAIRLKEDGPLELHIGLIESVRFWLPKLLASYSTIHPDIHIKLLEVLGFAQVEAALKNYQIHLAITNQLFESEEIEMSPIYTERLVALLPQGHPLQHTEHLSISDLKGEEFIICKEGFQTRNDILNEFRKSGIKPTIHFEIERFETACALVEEGLGITIVPENYLRKPDHPSLTVKKLTNSNLSRTVYIAYMKNRYLPPVIEEFIETTKEFFKDIS
ncbi:MULTISPECIES: LysR family transcriptional regulator [Sporosarcina]|uniref:LysR family transcriptional regulator n=1 Tax=Sporosarcina TaxID=1569 RepID=UPI00129B8706|nr:MULTISPECIES: LysR family transcriptional regulator [Sporosarcina]GKV66210.1 LysR family transcriptional regulator [Sporosarcina sp. NCCP-2331]GLB56182.1 LysR family transcriptional regulator [Sporosarcina sp. NCCP-2378]